MPQIAHYSQINAVKRPKRAKTRKNAEKPAELKQKNAQKRTKTPMHLVRNFNRIESIQ
jgi:hypothetical protein